MKHWSALMIVAALAACSPAPEKAVEETPAPVATPVDTPLQAPSQWTCADGRKLTVTFFGARVDLAFADGRKLSLPAVIAASGEAYEADAVRFHAKGDEAYIAEGEAVTNCTNDNAETK